ncbi:hypothetical protein [Cryobacterium sp. PH31-O1]|uniref:hypothetical protein n=1 Tax=Cryobacterium sp. PH31-O1 TaxID=3046306 RepID=UPI0024B8A22A|nr:hypothetical protein [Cryobacterium sp. PH31-O1]MDJ0337450.1 hypothetical protein [Cryobacterium sp. PH31-O1]
MTYAIESGRPPAHARSTLEMVKLTVKPGNHIEFRIKESDLAIMSDRDVVNEITSRIIDGRTLDADDLEEAEYQPQRMTWVIRVRNRT